MNSCCCTGSWIPFRADKVNNTGDSLMSFTDAVGLPVNANGESVAAVHVYKTNALFTEPDVRFCEALVGYLANGLNILRGRRALEAENSRLRGRVVSDDLIGASAPIKQLRSLIARVAPQPTTVLIVGESEVRAFVDAIDSGREAA